MNGVSTRKVERLIEQLGIESMSRSTVSRLCRVLDEQVRIFRTRPPEGRYPYLWLDARVERMREEGQRPPEGPGGGRGACTRRADAKSSAPMWGRQKAWGYLAGVPALALSPGVSPAFFCASLMPTPTSRRPSPRCSAVPGSAARVHFLRDMQGHVARSQQQMVAAAIRQVFQAEDLGQARLVLSEVVARLQPTVPKAAISS